jgi:uncharacterized protein YcbK (DUF882 family)
MSEIKEHPKPKNGLATALWPWPDFSPEEMACRHCGELYHWPLFMDRLQRARTRLGRPFRIHSAHRCAIHNARVGGAPLSQHLKLAVDIGLTGHDPRALHAALIAEGFRGFGFYSSFLHADLGRARAWYGSNTARTLWRNF